MPAFLVRIYEHMFIYRLCVLDRTMITIILDATRA